MRGSAGQGLDGLGVRRVTDDREENAIAIIEDAPVFTDSGLRLRYSPHDWRTLWGASALGQVGIVHFLLRRGEAVDRPDSDGRTPLSYAVEFGQTAVVSLLLEKGASPNRADRSGWTPLFFVAEPHAESRIAALIHAGADLNHRDTYGFSVLLYLRLAGRRRLAGWLERHGADWGFPEAAIVGRADLAAALPFFGDLDRPLPNGETFLTRAARQGDFTLAALLLERGADPNRTDRTGQTPLDAAENRGRLLRLLLDAGADPLLSRYPDLAALRCRAGIETD
ncbi:MAG: ankyrin repeat domain-containing protein [Capsulimonadales bacterium]|nr:ankyrin repeat domain-containing protein [Capsulimonadales bacterium]